jgi:hypothetical protein
MTDERRCEVCKGSLAGRRAGTKTCVGKCRTQAWRDRKAASASETAHATRNPLAAVVTVTEPLVTLTQAQAADGAGLARLVGPLCPDPSRCEHRWRHASGPWTCEANHPREEDAA